MVTANNTFAQDSKSDKFSYAGFDWVLEKNGEAGIRHYLGRDSLFLERSEALPLETDFSEGVIEFDVAAKEPSGFVGVNFHDDGTGNSEQFYVRFHQSERPDSTQYLARLNQLASWQLHAGPNDAAAVKLGTDQWIRVRIVVEDNRADIFVRDMDKPLIHAPELRSGNQSGNLILYATDRPGMVTGAYFSNISIRPLQAGEGVQGTANPEPDVPESVIRNWPVSSTFDEALLAETFDLRPVEDQGLEWTTRKVERNGVLNIARESKIGKGANTVLVRLKVTASTPVTRLFRFGYSDRIRLYVNGEQQFYGNAQWRSRDHRFLGTVGLHDAIPVKFRQGENEIVAAVSESFGGWGFIGQLEDREGLILDTQ
jgi:hypothetical protein